MPGSYTRLQRALAAEARAYEHSVAALETRARDERAAAAAQDGDGGDGEPQGACELDELSEVTRTRRRLTPADRARCGAGPPE
jgi:hypothetical protein